MASRRKQTKPKAFATVEELELAAAEAAANPNLNDISQKESTTMEVEEVESNSTTTIKATNDNETQEDKEQQQQESSPDHSPSPQVEEPQPVIQENNEQEQPENEFSFKRKRTPPLEPEPIEAELLLQPNKETNNLDDFNTNSDGLIHFNINGYEDYDDDEDDLDDGLSDDEDEDEEDDGLLDFYNSIPQQDHSNFAKETPQLYNQQQFMENHQRQQQQQVFYNSYQSQSAVDFCVQSMLLQFKCKVCGKGFKHRRSLNRHVRLHSGEKNFKCPQCGASFARSDHLKGHLRTHNNEKPYRCPVCQCGYSTQAALKVHIAHHHSKSKYRCLICDNLDFHSQLALEGHIYTKHSTNALALSEQLANNPNFQCDEQDMLLFNNAAAASAARMAAAQSGSVYLNGDSNESEHTSSCSPIPEEDLNPEEGVKNKDVDEEDCICLSDDEGEKKRAKILSPSNKTQVSPPELIALSRLQQMTNSNLDESIKTNLNPPQLIKLTNVVKPNGPLNPFEPKRLINPPQLSQIAKAPTNYRPIAIAPNNQSEQTPPSSRPINLQQTYCELCNARFSTMDSFVAHMRGCHPQLYQQRLTSMRQQETQNPQQPSYLTTILSKNQQPQPSVSSSSSSPTVTSSTLSPHNQPKIEPPKSLINGGIIIPIQTDNTNPVSSSSNNSLNQCKIAGCNCSNSNTPNVSAALNHHSHPMPSSQPPLVPPPIPIPSSNQCSSDLDLLVIRETHFTCVHCQLSVSNQALYIQHLKQEHCVEVFRCKLCKQMQLFDNLQLLKDHFFLVHQSQKYDLFKCRLCHGGQTVFHNLDDLYHHARALHPEAARQNKSLMSHLQQMKAQHQPLQQPNPKSLIPIQPRPQPPPMASINQSTPQILAGLIRPPPNVIAPVNGMNAASAYRPSPQQIQHQQPPHPCHFNQNSPYQNNNTFKCSHCGSDFAQMQSLNQHLRLVHHIEVNNNNHSSSLLAQGQGPALPCQHCRITFSNRTQLERHMRIHLSSIDLKCNICDQKFGAQEDLQHHIRIIHSKQQQQQQSSFVAEENRSPQFQSNIITCVYCKQKIENEVQFSDHFKRHNNIESLMDFQFNPSSSKTNSFICIVCRQTLCSSHEFQLHMRHHLRNRMNNPQQQQQQQQPKVQPPQQQSQPSQQTPESEKKNPYFEQDPKTNKLKCLKCFVKFETWSELTDHLTKDHNINLPNETPKEKTPIPTKEADSQPSPATANSNNNKSIMKQERKSPATVNAAPANPAPVTAKSSTPPPLVPSSSSNNNSIVESQLSPAQMQPSQQQQQVQLYYICFLCTHRQQRFDTHQHLQTHILLKHEFATSHTYACPVCDDLAFSRAEYLLSHTNHHGHAARIYKCSQCPQAFVFKAQLINHSYAHKFRIADLQNEQNEPQQNNNNNNNSRSSTNEDSTDLMNNGYQMNNQLTNGGNMNGFRPIVGGMNYNDSNRIMQQQRFQS